MKRKNTNKAFTLVEMIVVVLIIAMLAAFVAPKVFKKFGKAKKSIAAGQIGRICGALEDFALDCDRFPSGEEGFSALLEKPAELDEGKWSGPYLEEKQLLDPWGRAYVYQIEEAKYIIISPGPDGEPGTEDDILND